MGEFEVVIQALADPDAAALEPAVLFAVLFHKVSRPTGAFELVSDILEQRLLIAFAGEVKMRTLPDQVVCVDNLRLDGIRSNGQTTEVDRIKRRLKDFDLVGLLLFFSTRYRQLADFFLNNSACFGGPPH